MFDCTNKTVYLCITIRKVIGALKRPLSAKIIIMRLISESLTRKYKTMAAKTFKALYEEQKAKPTAAQVFITKIAGITKRSEMTVRMWIAGQQVPDELAQSVIANELGVPVEGLFPQKD